MIKSGRYGELWKELQRQIDEKGFKVIEGTIQDATFITSDPGRKRMKDDKKNGGKKEDQDSGEIGAVKTLEFDKDLLNISNNIIEGEAKPKRSREEPTNEGTWAKKGTKTVFGYKGHASIDTKHHLIRDVETTTASVHDSQVDLGIEEIPRYTDKGYDGAKTRAYDAAMKKATRGHKLGFRDLRRNSRISKKRSHIERCFAVMKRAHNAGHVLVATVARAGIKFMMNAFVYNLAQLKFLAYKKST